MKKTAMPNPLADARPGHRKVRSFVIREGRMTAAQMHAFEELWPRFGIVPQVGAALQPKSLFGRQAPLTLDIGFGNGVALATTAAASPQQDFIGIEVYRPGIGALLQRIEQAGLNNIRIICGDAVGVLQQHIEDHSLAAVQLLFPDPWPKKRHHKRRIVQSSFTAVVQRKLQSEGLLRLATDCANYAEHMRAVLVAQSGWIDQSHLDRAHATPAWRSETKFERRAKRQGLPIHNLSFQRAPP